jgi:hypothetical protein
MPLRRLGEMEVGMEATLTSEVALLERLIDEVNVISTTPINVKLVLIIDLDIRHLCSA